MAIKEILLNSGDIVFVDELDYECLNRFSWELAYDERYNLSYARNKILGLMHRFILSAPKGFHVDHIDGNGLNNIRKNIRICTESQNQMNRTKHKSGTSRYKGVYWDRSKMKWRAELVFKEKRYRLGYFKSENLAARCYNEKAIELFEDFVKLNIICDDDRFFPENYNVRNKGSFSGVTGISYDSSRNKWVASIHFNGIKKKLGRFDTKEEAIKALVDYYDFNKL